jgi:phosphopantothenoylcysteine decarboxylase / phosphopantothenate---cysteine ligase
LNIVLGVSGSIAAYRAADLARDMMREGWQVRVCLTEAASHFVSAELFEGLTGQPCLTGVFEEPIPGKMAHIDWARQADLLVIAPATANTINKLAAGVADDMLSTIALAFTGTVVMAPAMNPAMYLHEATQVSLKALAGRGVETIEPEGGIVACGEEGQGKFAAVPVILDAVRALAVRAGIFEGKKILITSGPTREPIDSVRYMSNESSGKMGFALARAAMRMGAEVSVVSGPTSEPAPFGAKIVRVQTASEMLAEATKLALDMDLIIGAAAVADYRAVHQERGKIRRSVGNISLELYPNPDIIASLAEFGKPTVAFSAEPNGGLEMAREKLVRKGVTAIAVNDISRGDIGFGSDFNEITLLFADGGKAESGRRTKLACAFWLLEQVARVSL